MNITIISAMFPPIQTGTSFYSRNLAMALKHRNHKVQVITVRIGENYNYDFKFKVKRILAIYLPIKRFFKHLSVCSIFPKNYLQVIKSTYNSDIVLLVNHYLDIAFPAVVASLINRIPLICSVGTQIQSINPYKNRILNFFDRLICGTFIFPFCSRIISWDKEIMRYLKDVHRKSVVRKSIIIPYGVNGDVESFVKYKHDYSVREQIIGIGAIIEQRNFLNLIRAYKEIINSFPEVILKIIGHIYYEEPLRVAKDLGIRDKIIFTGELPHKEVLEELKCSTLYWGLSTGKYKGLGTATIEAMLMGVPVVSNVPLDLFGENLLKDRKHIFHTGGISLIETAQRLYEILSNRELRKRVGLNGKRFVMKYLNWDSVSEQMELNMLETIK